MVHAQQAVEDKAPQPPLVRGKDKFPPLPKDAEAVEPLGEVNWPMKQGKPSIRQPIGVMPQTVIARTKEELLKAWVADGNNQESPPVCSPARPADPTKTRGLDLDKEMVIGVFWRGATDRDKIQIERVSRQGDKLIVEYRAYTLQRGGAAPRPTSVNHVVALPRMEQQVEFKALPPSVTVDPRLIP
jgi:hypothetical protein